jgi:hypothetical protein
MSRPPKYLRTGTLTKILYSFLTLPMLATSPAHLILPDLIVIIVLSEPYKLLSSSLCKFLLATLISSFVGLYILQKLLSQTS